MAHQANIPSPLCLEGNIQENWKKFIKNFEIYIGATGREKAKTVIDAMTENDKKEYYEALGKLLLNIAGEEATTVASTFDLSERDEFNYLKLKEKFKEYTSPDINETYERFVFARTRQAEGESFDHFLTEAKKKIKNCGYGNLADSILRDRIVEGIRDSRVREALLRVKNLTLKQAIEDCRTAEQSRNYAKHFHQSGESSLTSAPISTDALKPQKTLSKGYSKRSNQTLYPQPKRPSRNSAFKCKRCGYSHEFGKCPAFGKTCVKCHGKNHFQSVCRQQSAKTHSVDEAQTAESPEEDYSVYFTDTLQIINLSSISPHPREYRQNVKVEGKIVNFKLDPGASSSVMPFKIFRELETTKKISRAKVHLKPYGTNSSPLQVLGVVSLITCIGGISKNVKFLITNDADTPLFGLSDCEDFKLITRNEVPVNSARTVEVTLGKEDFLKRNRDVFVGCGKFPGTHPILTNPDARQVIRPAMRKPTSVMEKLQPALEKLESQKIIEKVEHLTADCWVSNTVIVTKPSGDIRICIDPTDLNKAIIREPYLIPTVAEMSEKLSHQKYYTLLDLKDGFYHIELDKPSRNKCCFSTPFGVYRFLRCPFGLASAPELFQKLNEGVFGKLKNVLVYFDDVLIVGNTEEEHDDAVNQVLARARECGVKFNPSKVQYKQTSVKYIGHVFSEAGMTMDPERVKALLQLDMPKNKKELQSMLGMFGYVRAFIPQLSDITSILRDLLKNNVIWNWTEAHSRAIEKVKSLIASAPVLANFNPKEKIVIQSDASQSGLGCCLFQNGHPVTFASRCLSPSECNYSVSEKELLGICFATSKFHNFIFGYPVEVHTDHQPLVPMMNKEIHKLGSRTLQRLRLKLLKYNINLVYVPGKQMHVSDLFSRFYLQGAVQDDPSMFDIVHTVSIDLPVSNGVKQELVTATKQDGALQNVTKYVKVGWPKQVTQVPDNVQPYFKVRHQLFVEDGLVILNEINGNVKIVVPSTQRYKLLKLIHSGHMGIEKCKLRAKELFYWPSMYTHVEFYVKSCATCQKFQAMPPKHSLHPHPLPKLMWERISADIASYGGKDYLVLFDAYSKWLEIVQLPAKSALAVIEVCKTIFCTHGHPKIMVADNNPFNSYDFRQFAKQYEFELVHSSPYLSNSNGRAEKGVSIAKAMLKKAQSENSDFREFLREYRNTPVPSMSASPAQLMFSRRLRTVLPVCDKALKPSIQKSVVSKLNHQKKRTENWYNKSVTRKELDLKTGDDVLINTGKKGEEWSQGTIVSKLSDPRSFLVRTQNGTVVRRSTYHLRSSHKLKSTNCNDFDYDFRRQPQVENCCINNNPVCNSTKNPDPECELPSFETNYQLIVPDWLFRESVEGMKTRSGKIVRIQENN